MNRKEFVKMSGLAMASGFFPPITRRNQAMPDKSELQTLVTGLDIGESPRWHRGRLWFCNWIKQEISAVDTRGNPEVILKLPFSSFPFSIDWLPDGRMIIVSNSDQPLLRMEHDQSLVPHADLTAMNIKNWNEIVIDGRGNIYINGGDIIALITPDGTVHKMADGLSWPNGMLISPDHSKLVVAESFGNKLTGFNISADGSLGNRYTWADLKDGVPDGICMDGDGHIWYADVPNKCCVRVKEGGEILKKIDLDRGGFACILGGKKRRTLFIMSSQWYGFEKLMDSRGTGQIQFTNVTSAGVGYP